MAQSNGAFTVEMGEEFYSLVPPGAESGGAPVPYGDTACVRVNDVVYYCHIEEPEEYPVGGDAPEVHMVESTVVVPSQMEEVDDDDDEEEEEETTTGPTLVADEDEDEDEEDDEELGAGDDVEFRDEEEDENLPPAQDQR